MSVKAVRQLLQEGKLLKRAFAIITLKYVYEEQTYLLLLIEHSS